MTVRRTGTARHRITSVHAGHTTVHLVDLTQGWTIRYTPAAIGARLWADATGRLWSDATTRQWAA